jgi:hypothetical protein
MPAQYQAQCHKELYVVKKAEILKWARCYDLGQIRGVLFGGSSKKLMSGSAGFIPLPTVINFASFPGVIVTDPASVAEGHLQSVWSNVMSWMTPLYGQLLQLWLTFMLCSIKGTLILHQVLMDGRNGALRIFLMKLLVLDLHNYLVINMSFPIDVKDTHLTYFCKHGIHTNLSNWRGLQISNFLANSPITWLDFRLSPYAACKGIILETQVATQPLGTNS